MLQALHRLFASSSYSWRPWTFTGVRIESASRLATGCLPNSYMGGQLGGLSTDSVSNKVTEHICNDLRQVHEHHSRQLQWLSTCSRSQRRCGK